MMVGTLSNAVLRSQRPKPEVFVPAKSGCSFASTVVTTGSRIGDYSGIFYGYRSGQVHGRTRFPRPCGRGIPHDPNAGASSLGGRFGLLLLFGR